MNHYPHSVGWTVRHFGTVVCGDGAKDTRDGSTYHRPIDNEQDAQSIAQDWIFDYHGNDKGVSVSIHNPAGDETETYSLDD